MTQDPREVLNAEVLSERAARYRRNVIVLAGLAIGLFCIPGANLSDASIFNIKLENEQSRGFWSWTLLTLLLIYNFCLFSLYTSRDFRNWWEVVRGGGFQEMRMYLGIRPSKHLIRKNKGWGEDVEFKIERCGIKAVEKHADRKKLHMEAKTTLKRKNSDKEEYGKMHMSQAAYIERRRSVLWFLSIDSVPPVLLGMLGIVFAFSHIVTLAPTTGNQLAELPSRETSNQLSGVSSPNVRELAARARHSNF